MTATDQDITENNKQDAQEFEGLQTPFKRFLSDFCESKLAVLGFLVIVGIVLLAIFAPVLTPTDPYDLTSVTILDSSCLLYTSPSPRDLSTSRMPSSA